MKTTKQRVAELLIEKLTAKQILEKLTAEGVKTTIATVSYYRTKIKKVNATQTLPTTTS
jgi:hypothetical protein